ncbi:hypothetical protein GDO78_021522 [Eleutherodactylus coqui]|uniref:Uncharacterized protein n=1 Tax=Eleutherodactylus coqui TaxID=57060 RepID=A0A8J6ENG5_ELECQ|nr:hypothetical protein GDO78_021522 [Eleutherodactylus coqui]
MTCEGCPGASTYRVPIGYTWPQSGQSQSSSSAATSPWPVLGLHPLLAIRFQNILSVCGAAINLVCNCAKT